MRDHTQASAQSKFRNSDSRRFYDCRFQPLSKFDMSLRVFAVRVDENIDIKKFHGRSMMSRRADEEIKSTPGIVPFPPNVLIGLCSPGFMRFDRLANAKRRPSSTISPRDLPVDWDTLLALSRSPSSMETVVRMHQSIRMAHHDVKWLVCRCFVYCFRPEEINASTREK